MIGTAAVLFWFGLACLLAVWFVYPAILWLIARRTPEQAARLGGEPKSATVLIAAHNEAGNIAPRLDNIFLQSAPGLQLDVLVALDHCTDSTEQTLKEWVAAHADRPVAWFETTHRGKAMAHNEAMPRIISDLVIFTDADTEFKPGFIAKIAACFADPRVGYASGILSWRGKTTPAGVSSFPLYWRFETWLRLMESRLDICVVGTGACSAMRPNHFIALHPTSDSDCSTPIDVVRQGYLCRIVNDAEAVDFVADTASQEFRARVRMTAKNFLNTITSWNWRNGVITRPAVTASLILHKIGRWLTPFFGLSFVAGGTMLAAAGVSNFASSVTALAWAGLATGGAGLLAPSLPLAGAIGSFMLANAAFAIGVVKALTGRAPGGFDKS